MTQRELWEELARRLGIPGDHGEIIVGALLDIVEEMLAGGDYVSLRIGRFTPIEMPARSVRIPNGSLMLAPARFRVRYRPAQALLAKMLASRRDD